MSRPTEYGTHCERCDEEITGPPVVNDEEMYWRGYATSVYCSTGCQEDANDAAADHAATYPDYDSGGESPSYRRDMIDAGRGHLLR